jgi:membrane protein DedA with SNARE-associated domain
MGAPIPAEPTLVVAGSLAARHMMSRPGLVAVTLAAATLADVTWFVLGHRSRAQILRLVDKRGQAEHGSTSWRARVFQRWGLKALVVAKFLPAASQVLVPIAGATRVSFRAFILYDVLGTAVWASVPIGGGMVFHERVDVVLAAMARAGVWLLASCGLLIAVLVVRRLLGRTAAAPQLGVTVSSRPS